MNLNVLANYFARGWMTTQGRDRTDSRYLENAMTVNLWWYGKIPFAVRVYPQGGTERNLLRLRDYGNRNALIGRRINLILRRLGWGALDYGRRRGAWYYQALDGGLSLWRGGIDLWSPAGDRPFVGPPRPPSVEKRIKEIYGSFEQT